MRLLYSKHLILRIAERKFPDDYPKKIFYQPEQKFYDCQTNYNISVRRLVYNGKTRPIQLIWTYDKNTRCVKIITIYPIKQKEINNKVSTRRWIVR